MAAPRCSTWHPRRAASSSWSPPNRGATRSSRTRSPTPRSARTACWPSAEPEPASEAVHLTALTSTPSDRCRRSDATCNLLARSKRLRRWWHDHRPADPAIERFAADRSAHHPGRRPAPRRPAAAVFSGDDVQPVLHRNPAAAAGKLQWLAKVDHFRREALVACVDQLADHPLPALLRAGLLVTINSQDPSYFGGYVEDNFRAVQRELGLTDEQLRELAANSVRASFPPPEDRTGCWPRWRRTGSRRPSPQPRDLGPGAAWQCDSALPGAASEGHQRQPGTDRGRQTQQRGQRSLRPPQVVPRMPCEQDPSARHPVENPLRL